MSTTMESTKGPIQFRIVEPNCFPKGCPIPSFEQFNLARGLLEIIKTLDTREPVPSQNDLMDKVPGFWSAQHTFCKVCIHSRCNFHPEL